MKFGKQLASSQVHEWTVYYLKYKTLKKTIKQNSGEAFDEELAKSTKTMARWYHDKEKWAVNYCKTLEKRVDDLRASAQQEEPGSPSSLSSAEEGDMTTSSPTGIADDLPMRLQKFSQKDFDRDATYLKESFRKMGASQHFQDYIYAKKSLTTFQRELDLLIEFLDVNKTAFSKILKKFDKKTGNSIREERLAAILEENTFLNGEKLEQMRGTVNEMLEEVNSLKPNLPYGWDKRKVYTIGCFDLFHRGHQNVLLSLREFGAYIVCGIHDDESYFKLKNKYTIDNLETRMKNVKPFVDQIYVIPSTDPLLYIKSMVSDQDIANGSCCYARGDDMLNFPGREWVESVMPVHFVPRTEACSSTLIRTIYHADSAEIREKAAFAKTRYDGKPIDENGNVLKFQA